VTGSNPPIWYKCPKEVACSKNNPKDFEYTYDWDSPLSLTNYIYELSIECEPAYKIKLIGCFYFAGVLVSIVLWTMCTDFFGRKKIILLGPVMQLAAFAGVSFCNRSLLLVYLYYLLLGCGSVITICTSYNYLVEFTPRRHRIAVGTLYISVQVLPALLMPVYLSMVSDDPNYYLFIGFVASICGFLFLQPLPESPKYLFSKEMYQQCEDSLNFISRFNGSGVVVDMQRQIEDLINSSLQRVEPTLKQTQLQWFLGQMLLNNHNRHLLVFILCWSVVSLTYYVILFHFQEMAGNLYFNGFASALAELLGNLFIGNLIQRFGLKHTLEASFTSMCVTMFFYFFPLFSSNLYYAIVLFVLKFGLTGAFAAVFFGTNSLFREDLVAVIFAICNLFARLFTVFAPFIASA